MKIWNTEKTVLVTINTAVISDGMITTSDIGGTSASKRSFTTARIREVFPVPPSHCFKSPQT